jgi:hypothetical protein
VSPGRKIAPKFVQVRGSSTRFFLLFMLIITEDPAKKNGAKF